MNATQNELQAAGVTDTLKVVVADAGCWHRKQMEAVINDGIQIQGPAPMPASDEALPPVGHSDTYAHMRRVLETDHGGGLYPKRPAMIEPVFANTKFNRRIDRFQRRGRSTCAPNGG